jgi:hypothetical protein
MSFALMLDCTKLANVARLKDQLLDSSYSQTADVPSGSYNASNELTPNSSGSYNLWPGGNMAAKVNWKGLEEVGETRILDALRLALNATNIADISRKTGIPPSSLSSIKCQGPYAHRKKGQFDPQQSN